jgi:hypothetical protein
MSSYLKLQVEDLGNAIDKLPERDRPFAQDLCNKFWKGGLSPKQAVWIERLLDRAENPPQSTEVGSVKGIVDLLDGAKLHLKHPAIIVRANDRDIRLSIAGPTAKVPGSINVCSAEGGFGSREWYGRITREGVFDPSRKHDSVTQTAVATALKAMASDPAKAAANYGHLTGHCCFCNRSLDDARSTEVGYGPVCAKHYRLPWGETALKAAA